MSKTPEVLIVEKHTEALHRGFHRWPEMGFAPPALGDRRWTPELILSTWVQAETSALPTGDLEYRTNWVATVIKCGPLLGLFGTVLGMMAAFGRIGTGEKVQPSQIADEISIALICTAMGLGTAIPFNFMLASLTARIRRFQDALGAGLVRVLDVMKTKC